MPKDLILLKLRSIHVLSLPFMLAESDSKSSGSTRRGSNNKVSTPALQTRYGPPSPYHPADRAPRSPMYCDPKPWVTCAGWYGAQFGHTGAGQGQHWPPESNSGHVEAIQHSWTKSWPGRGSMGSQSPTPVGREWCKTWSGPWTILMPFNWPAGPNPWAPLLLTDHPYNGIVKNWKKKISSGKWEFSMKQCRTEWLLLVNGPRLNGHLILSCIISY